MKTTQTTTHQPNPTPEARNVHLIAVKYHGPTNNKGARVSLTSQRFPANRVTMSYDYETGNINDQAKKWLSDNGYTVLFYAEARPVDFIAVAEFEELRKAK